MKEKSFRHLAALIGKKIVMLIFLSSINDCRGYGDLYCIGENLFYQMLLQYKGI